MHPVLVGPVLDAHAGAYVHEEVLADGIISEPVGRGFQVEFQEEAAVTQKSGGFKFRAVEGSGFRGDGPRSIDCVVYLTCECNGVHDVEIQLSRSVEVNEDLPFLYLFTVA